jgi:fumarate hydratase class II
MGDVQVPNDRYWGAQTQRSIENFPIGHLNGKNRMPLEVVRAFAILKQAAAQANHELGVLPKEKSDIIGSKSKGLYFSTIVRILNLLYFCPPS